MRVFAVHSSQRESLLWDDCGYNISSITCTVLPLEKVIQHRYIITGILSGESVRRHLAQLQDTRSTGSEPVTEEGRTEECVGGSGGMWKMDFASAVVVNLGMRHVFCF